MEHIILLHGAAGSGSQLLPLKQKLQDKFIVHVPDLPGHGGSELPASGFSIESFSKFLSAYIDEKELNKVILFGYSMGGYVAMYAAATFPSKVKSVITLGTKFLWDESIASEEVKMLDQEVIMEKVPAFGEDLKRRHLPHDWKMVLATTKEMLLRMGIHNPLQLAHFHNMKPPCLILTGDRDKTVSIGESLAVYKQLNDAQLGVIPLSAHAIDKTDIDLLAYMIFRFSEKQ